MRSRPDGTRLLAITIVLLFSSQVFGHSGRTDSLGCHHDRQRGGYHCHSGPLAGQSFSSKEEAQAALAALEDSTPSGDDSGDDSGGETPQSGLLEIHYINVQQRRPSLHWPATADELDP